MTPENFEYSKNRIKERKRERFRYDFQLWLPVNLCGIILVVAIAGNVFGWY